MRIFKTSAFAKWAKSQRIDDNILEDAIQLIDNGLIYADLGGGLIKQALPKPGHSKRKSCRALIAVKRHDRSVFIFGFSKNDRDNIENDEKLFYKKLANYYLNLTHKEIEHLVKTKELIEVN